MAQVIAPMSPLHHLSSPSQGQSLVKQTTSNLQRKQCKFPSKNPSPKPAETKDTAPKEQAAHEETTEESIETESDSEDLAPKKSAAKIRIKEEITQSLEIPCLNELGLYAFPTKGDGNCLYYALSDQMYGTPDYADQIRLQLADHIAAHRDYFINFIVAAGGERRAPRRAAASRYSSSRYSSSSRHSSSSSSASPAPSSEDIERSFESKLEGCRKNGTWGGSEDIQAFCQSFKVDVRVYSTKGIQTFRDVYAPGSEERAILHVAFHDFNHYSSVRHVDGPHTGLPRIPKDLKAAGRSSKASPPSSSSAGTKRSADESEDEDARPAVRRKKLRVRAPEKLSMKLRSRSSSRALSPPSASMKRSADETADEDSQPTIGAKPLADETADENSRPVLGAKRSVDDTTDQDPRPTHGAKRSADESEDEDPRPAVRRKRARVGAPENKLTMKLRSRSSSRAVSPSLASTKRSADKTVDENSGRIHGPKRSADETAEEDPRPTFRRRRLRSRIGA